MNRVTSVRSGSVAMAVLLSTAWAARAQMHGGHSMHEHGSEVSEAPTATDVADAVENYVRQDAKMKGGYFLVYDPVRQVPLALTLDRVREDGLRMIDDHEYFTGADFKTDDGSTYDLDVFMKGPDKDHLEVAAITLHKENGTPRYDWQERNGVWTKREIAPSARKP